MTDGRTQKVDLPLLADTRRFGLDAERWEAFTAALDAPVRPLPRIQKLLSEPSVFERK